MFGDDLSHPWGLRKVYWFCFTAAVTFDRSTEHGAMVVLSCLLYAVVYSVIRKE